LEARKPKEACILARESGVVEISRSEDEAVGVRVIEDSGRVTEYRLAWVKVALSDGTAVAGNAPMVQRIHMRFWIFSLISILHEVCMPVRWKHCSVCKRFGE